MSKEQPSIVLTSETAQPSTNHEPGSQPGKKIERRSFLRGMGVAGAALTAAPLLRVGAKADDGGGSLSKGDAAILRFVAAAEIIESDIWLQYNELAGVQDGEVSKLASQLIPGYPAQITGGNIAYTNDVKQLDGDMDQYEPFLVAAAKEILQKRDIAQLNGPGRVKPPPVLQRCTTRLLPIQATRSWKTMLDSLRTTQSSIAA